MYDETTKIIILSKKHFIHSIEIIDDIFYHTNQQQEKFIGIAVYNVANITFIGLAPNARVLTLEEINNEYVTGEISNEKKTNEYLEADKEFKLCLREKNNSK